MTTTSLVSPKGVHSMDPLFVFVECGEGGVHVAEVVEDGDVVHQLLLLVNRCGVAFHDPLSNPGVQIA